MSRVILFNIFLIDIFLKFTYFDLAIITLSINGILLLIFLFFNINYIRIKYLIFFTLLVLTPSIYFTDLNLTIILRYYYLLCLFTFISVLCGEEYKNKYELSAHLGKLFIAYGIVLYINGINDFYLRNNKFELAIPSIYIIYGVFLFLNKNCYKAVLYVILLSYFIISIIAHSRGAALCTFTLISVIFLDNTKLKINKNKIKKIILYSMPLIYLIVIFLGIHFENDLDFNKSHLTGRAIIWSFWLEIISSNSYYLFFGLGDSAKGSLFDIYSLTFNKFENWLFISSPHNLLISELCRSGLYGTGILLIGYYLKVKNNINCDYDSNYYGLFLVFIVGGLFSGQNLANYSIENFIIIFTFLMLFNTKNKIQ